mmetsp:Transcript_76048/g.125521  ORF Transcript_76048/g.125521 Transcript_76048/m.125521 type:complete len:200 (-) Transcript_76048:313-912(-)
MSGVNSNNAVEARMQLPLTIVLMNSPMSPPSVLPGESTRITGNASWLQTGILMSTDQSPQRCWQRTVFSSSENFWPNISESKNVLRLLFIVLITSCTSSGVFTSRASSISVSSLSSLSLNRSGRSFKPTPRGSTWNVLPPSSGMKRIGRNESGTALVLATSLPKRALVNELFPTLVGPVRTTSGNRRTAILVFKISTSS